MLGHAAPARRRRAAQLARAFAHTLIPIAAGYLVAHYFSLLAYNGQDLWRLASDPLGNGSDLLRRRRAAHRLRRSSPPTGIWYVQVGALVIGHVAALVLAHDRALELYGGARDATRSQVVMLIVMVAFTCLGLWLLSAALNMIVFAHAGHWAVDAALPAPVVLLVVAALNGRRRERREARREGDGAPD